MSVKAAAAGWGGGHGHAVVIGSGPAGLAAARALANFMDHVTVVERDRVPHGPGRRRGVPQARHTHTLAAAAQQGLEELFPGITGNLTAAGAVRLRMSADMLVLGPAGWLPRFDSPPTLLSAGRDLLDAVLRDRLRAEARVAFLPEHEVVSLQPGRNDTVEGVWVRARDRTAAEGRGPRRLIPADFVVDASGRGSRAPQWLAELGYRPPWETVLTTRTAYASALYTPPVGHVANWSALLLMGTPDDPRQGMLHPVEGGRWSVTLCAADGTLPPAGHAQLLHAAAALRHPLLHDVIRAAAPLGPVYGAHRLENRWRHYERLRRWPDRFLVVGDAFVTLDPAHGHGMTLAVQSALVLDRLLAAHGTASGVGHRLRRALAHQLAPAWQAGTRSAGAALPDRDGRAGGLRARRDRRHAARLATAATTDPRAASVLLGHLQTAAVPPAGLPRPSRLSGVLTGRRTPAPAGTGAASRPQARKGNGPLHPGKDGQYASGHDNSGATSLETKRLEVH